MLVVGFIGWWGWYKEKWGYLEESGKDVVGRWVEWAGVMFDVGDSM